MNPVGNIVDGLFLHLHGRGQPLQLIASLGIVCGDLDALFKSLCSKGQNANVPCPLHSNVVSLKSGWARDGSVLRAFNCLDMSEMLRHTDATIREVVRTLARAVAERDAGRMAGAAFDALSTELGWSHSSDNILMGDVIKFDVASAVHVDWLHTYLQTGIFNYEVAFLFTLFRHGAGAVKNVKFDMARGFSSKLAWPRRFASPAHLLKKRPSEQGVAALQVLWV